MGITATCDKCKKSSDWHSLRRIRWEDVFIKVTLDDETGKFSSRLLCNSCIGNMLIAEGLEL